MTTSRFTDLEAKMLEKGYVSARMAGAKLGKHPKSVLRQVTRGQFSAKWVGHQKFISIKSIQDHYGSEASALLNLQHWEIGA